MVLELQHQSQDHLLQEQVAEVEVEEIKIQEELVDRLVEGQHYGFPVMISWWRWWSRSWYCTISNRSRWRFWWRWRT